MRKSILSLAVATTLLAGAGIAAAQTTVATTTWTTDHGRVIREYSTTQKYTHVSAAKLMAVYDKAHPKA